MINSAETKLYPEVLEVSNYDYRHQIISDSVECFNGRSITVAIIKRSIDNNKKETFRAYASEGCGNGSNCFKSVRTSELELMLPC